ncbi:hypothetical protein [Tepidibacter formicigenes]|jgi:hypothetical protein|uniref:Uncharacterized protein n=1 Tax=Tepidibacter formicigenes DSM 15518 TaxID=1123349 RepID=A0A1M6SM45_9FIRM|nr:hypothetical protein [Tepidibacter formicigenes]SHK45854.1 hypothetical protein SAMN02744037_02377 [Tepidibacter formicigenes DSM 15518]
MSEYLKNIIEIFETKSYKEANEYLKIGWILLDKCIVSYYPEGNFPKHEQMKYILGWNSNLGEIIKPQPKYICDIPTEDKIEDIECDF